MNSFLKFFISFALIIILHSKDSQSNLSGLKVALDLDNLSLLKKVNFNKLFENKTFLTNGTSYGNGGSFGYKINLGNISIATFSAPQNTSCETIDVQSNTPSIKLILKNVLIKILVDYYVQASFYEDSGLQKAAQVQLDQISVDFTFNNTSNYIKVNHISLEIGSLDIDFNGKVLKALFYVVKSFLTSTIKSKVDSLSPILEELINNHLTTPNLFNIDGQKIIGLNLTVTEVPYIKSFNLNVPPKNTGLKFLGFQSSNSSKFIFNLASFLVFGIDGAIYPYSLPPQNYTFRGPQVMGFEPNYLHNNIVLFLSDYTINTVMNLAQQSGNIWTKISNDTTLQLPFTIDTKGLRVLVPELSDYFSSENYNCSLKVGVMGMHKQPIVSTHDEGSLVSLNFGIFIVVHNESSVWDDEFNALNLNVNLDINVQTYFNSDNLFSVNFGSASVKGVTAISNIGNINTERSKNIIKSIINTALTTYSQYFKNIDVINKIKDLIGIKFHDFVIDHNEGHLAILFNYHDWDN